MADTGTNASAPLFIVNPMAGGGRTRRRLGPLVDAIQRRGLQPDLVLTERPGHGYELARAAIEAGRETLVAVGGDGTVNEVANAIIDLGAADRVRVGTVPVGTGKDIGRCLGMLRPAAGLRAVARGEERRIDVGRVEAVDARGEPWVRHFLLEASAGWVPEIAHAVPRPLKRLGDTAPYLVMTAVKMAGPMSRPFEVRIDDDAYDGPYNSISVHNMEYWGGDLLAAPGARPDDGAFDVIRWGDLGRAKVLKAVQGQRNGGAHMAMDGIDHHVAKEVRLSSPKRTQLDVDGEAGGYLPATITIVPGAIRFLAPPA